MLSLLLLTCNFAFAQTPTSIKVSGNCGSCKKNIEKADSYFIFPSLNQKIYEIKNGLDANIISSSARTIRIIHQHTNSIFSKDIEAF